MYDMSPAELGGIYGLSTMKQYYITLSTNENHCRRTNAVLNITYLAQQFAAPSASNLSLHITPSSPPISPFSS